MHAKSLRSAFDYRCCRLEPNRSWDHPCSLNEEAKNRDPWLSRPPSEKRLHPISAGPSRSVNRGQQREPPDSQHRATHLPAKAEAEQKQQNLFRRDNRMVRLTRSKGQNRIDVCTFEIGIVLQDRLVRLANR